jgi:hypothetical protein
MQPPSREPDPLAGAPAAPAGADQQSRRRLWSLGDFTTSVVLAVIGVGLGVFAFVLYPSPGGLTEPSFATLDLTSAAPVGNIDYDVRQLSAGIARVTVEITLTTTSYPAGQPPAKLYLFPPPGVHFTTCPSGYCLYERSVNLYESGRVLSFAATPVFTGSSNDVPAAFATFDIHAAGFGLAFSPVDASAALPEIVYTGPGTPTLVTEYESATSAGRYDWSAFPPEDVTATKLFWDEPVVSGAAQGRVTAGVDAANQQKNSNDTFFAGALLGLAGGALLSALQEGLHTRADRRARARRAASQTAAGQDA